MKHSAIKTDDVLNGHRNFKKKLIEGVVIVLAWGMALSLVYLVYFKIKLFIH